MLESTLTKKFAAISANLVLVLICWLYYPIIFIGFENLDCDILIITQMKIIEWSVFIVLTSMQMFVGFISIRH